MRRPLALLALTAAMILAAAGARAEESSRDVICGLIEAAAADHALPPAFLTRLIWRESSFRLSARSHAGAQGIAQFMPETAAERGLLDPFDPAAAIPASAAYLSELRTRFGTLGLAAAAYNAGPGRIARWRAGAATLPDETRAHVRFVTGQEPGAADRTGEAAGCLVTLAAIRARPAREAGEGLERAIAKWGVQLVAGTDREVTLARFARMQRRYAGVMGGERPTVLTTRLGGRGGRSFTRIRIAFDDRRSADGLCRRLRAAGGSCLTVLN